MEEQDELEEDDEWVPWRQSLISASAGVRKGLKSSRRLVFLLCLVRCAGCPISSWRSFCLELSGRLQILTVFVAGTSSTGTHVSGSLKTRFITIMLGYKPIKKGN